MAKGIDYLARLIVTAAAASNLVASNSIEEKEVVKYLKNSPGQILEVEIDSIGGHRISSYLEFRNIEGRDILTIIQPLSGEDAKNHGLDLPSGQLAITNEEAQGNLDRIVNKASIDSRSRKVFMALSLDGNTGGYIQLIYDYTMRQVYGLIMNSRGLRA